MRHLTEHGVIVVIPRIYLKEAIREYGLGFWPTVIGLIQDHTEIELPDNANLCAAFDMEIKDDFEANTLLVRITATEPVPGLFEIVPGSHYVHTRMRVS